MRAVFSSPLPAAALAVGLALAACSRPAMNPAGPDVDGVLYSISNASQAAGSAGAGADTDGDKRAALHRVLVEPVEHAGFDFEASLRTCATAYTTGELSSERQAAVGTFLRIYAANKDELQRLGLISPETAQALGAVSP